MKKLGFLVLAGFAACSNVSSSELTETAAEDVALYARVYEYNDEDLADVSALLQTIPDGVGIQFNQGETLEAGLLLDDDVDYTAMSYDSNFLDLGETYVASISKPNIGEDYYVRYTDSDGLETTVTFSSDGVPDLTSPEDGAEIEIGSVVDLTWDTQSLGDLYVKVTFENTAGGTTIVQTSIADTGSYSLDLSDSDFDEMAPGDTTITLRHNTEYDSMNGFGDADVTVSSDFNRQVTMVEP